MKLFFSLGSGLSYYSGNGGQATSANVRFPEVVCSDTNGNMFVSSEASRICKIDSSGIISTFAGSGLISAPGDGLQATSATLYDIFNCVVDSSANVYLSTSGNRAIRVISASTTIISKFAGTGSNPNAGGTGDGGPATSAQLTPSSIFLDTVGNMYSAEINGYRVRKIAAGGNKIITNFAGSGVYSFTGMGGLATSATIWGSASTVGGDSSGNIFIGDYKSLLRVDEATNIIDVYAGELQIFLNSFVCFH